ncbi:MAG: HD domain-containing phosphohydrolase [Anaerolineaceae bacterium]
MIRIDFRKVFISLLIPGIACLFQYFFWDHFKPFIWFLFYPAVFLSAQISGRWGGLAAAIFSAGLAVFFFVDPIYSFTIVDPMVFYSIIIFILMGFLFGNLQQKLIQEHNKAEESLLKLRKSESSLQKLNDELEERVDERARELQKTEQRFKNLFENMLEGAQILGFDWKYLFLNETAEKHNRRPNRELLGNIYADMWPGIKDTLVYSKIKQCMEERIACNMENEFIFPDGTDRWFELRIQPIAEGTFILSIDITERIQAEQKISDLVKRFDLATDAAHLGVWDWHIPNDQLIWDDRMYELYGVKKEDFSGAYEAWLKGLYPEDRPPREIETQKALNGEKEYDTEFRVVWPDGTLRWLKSYGIVIRDEQDVATRMIGINFDISNQKAAEVKINQQAKHLKILADASQNFVAAVLDLHTLLERVAQQVSEVLDANCYVRLLSDIKDRLYLAAMYDTDPEAMEGARILLSKTTLHINDPGICAQVFGLGKSVYFPIMTNEQLLASVSEEVRPYFQKFQMHSLIAVPLGIQGARFGILTLARYRVGQPPFDEEDLKLAQELANRAALAISNARLIDQVQQELIVRKESEENLAESEERLKTVFDASPDAIFISDANGQVLEVNSVAVERYGYSHEEVLRMKLKDLAIPSFEDDISEETRDALRRGLPIEWRNRKKDGGEIPVEIIHRPFLLQGQPCIFTSVRDTTERLQAQQSIQLQLQRLRALRTIDLMISSNIDLRPTLDVLLDQVISQLKVDAAAILLFDKNLQTFEYAAGHGFRTQPIKMPSLRLGEGYAGKAAMERRLIHVPNINESENAPENVKLITNESFVAYFGVPLIAKGWVKGVMEIFHRSLLEPEPEWLDFLNTLAGQAAIAIDDAQLFNSLQRSNDELAQAYDATIEGWSRAMDLRDKETEGHTLRVTKTTVTLAQASGMSYEQIIHIRRGALLHDIGKLGVPDGILLKPGKLTEEEWIIMRQHPVYAYEMLSSIDYLRPAMDIPYCHHEKWDGTGYPRQLKGEEIPVAARLFAVVDVCDALRSDRPYRSSWSEEKVFEYIRAETGTHFDPRAVELFFQVMNDRDLESD